MTTFNERELSTVLASLGYWRREGLPRTETGKIRRLALAQLLRDGALLAAFV